MQTELSLIYALVALLLGLVVGKGWERYKLRDGRWIDRRRLRETPHYMLGLNFLVDNQVDQAIDELTQAASTDGDALEIQMILGNLYRQKGQVSRAISVHQSLLQRQNLTTLEHAYVLLCLGLDFRHGGFVDRAMETFQEVVLLDPGNRYALVHLQKLCEEQHQWPEALKVREQVAAIDTGRRSDDRPILAFLRNEIGAQQAKDGDLPAAAKTFQAAIDVDESTTPAYLNLGDVRERQGHLPEAIAAWEQLVDTSPDRAYLAFERLERAYGSLGAPHRFIEVCQRLISRSPQEWRARVALSRHLTAAARPREAFELLLEALPPNPHALSLHQQLWQVLSEMQFDPSLVQRYVVLARNAVFYLDPHVCTRCRYRSTELLWKCPQCHEWNTFVEERMAPAKEATAELDASP